MEFMGIPIDGSISTFEAQLKTKGFVKDKQNGSTNAGSIFYEGIFAGKEVSLLVYYTKTGLVYAVSVFQDFETMDDLMDRWRYYTSIIEDKYKNKIQKTNVGADDISYVMQVGTIGVKFVDLEQFTDYILSGFKLMLMYIDMANSLKKSEMDRDDI